MHLGRLYVEVCAVRRADAALPKAHRRQTVQVRGLRPLLLPLRPPGPAPAETHAGVSPAERHHLTHTYTHTQTRRQTHDTLTQTEQRHTQTHSWESGVSPLNVVQLAWTHTPCGAEGEEAWRRVEDRSRQQSRSGWGPRHLRSRPEDPSLPSF